MKFKQILIDIFGTDAQEAHVVVSCSVCDQSGTFSATQVGTMLSVPHLYGSGWCCSHESRDDKDHYFCPKHSDIPKLDQDYLDAWNKKKEQYLEDMERDWEEMNPEPTLAALIESVRRQRAGTLHD